MDYTASGATVVQQKATPEITPAETYVSTFSPDEPDAIVLHNSTVEMENANVRSVTPQIITVPVPVMQESNSPNIILIVGIIGIGLILLKKVRF